MAGVNAGLAAGAARDPRFATAGLDAGRWEPRAAPARALAGGAGQRGRGEHGRGQSGPGLLGDGAPAALFQTYQPHADPVGEVYPVQPGDHGIHFLIGPPPRPARPEPGFTGHLFGFLVDFVFADPTHQRIVAEPDARNDRAQARLRRTGFVDGPLVDLPDKQARLMFLDRAAAGR